MVSHWSLSDNKSLQVSRTLLGILTDLNNAVVWMISTRPVISTNSCLVFYSFLANLPHSLIIILIISSLSSYNLHSLFSCVLSIFLSHTLSLWRSFMLLLKEIKFLSRGFHFLGMSKFSCGIFRLLVSWYIHTIVFLSSFPSYCCSIKTRVFTISI